MEVIISGSMESALGSAHGNKTRSVVDPCGVLCASSDGGCVVSKNVGGQCTGLMRDESSRIVHTETSRPGLTSISADDARAIVSVQNESCKDICDRIEECTASYCKQNNHCHGLFWSDLAKREACFYTIDKPCNTKVPVLCDYEQSISLSTTTIPVTTDRDYTDESITAESTPANETESPSGTFEVSSVPEDSPISPESATANLTPYVTGEYSPQDDSDTSATVNTVSQNVEDTSNVSARSVSDIAAEEKSPIRASQNQTQPSKSFEALGTSTFTYTFIIGTLVTMIK
jgi:hypothetical protein